MKTLVGLFSISFFLAGAATFAGEVKAPSGNYLFKGKVGLVSGTEAVRAFCSEAAQYKKDGFRCQAATRENCQQPDSTIRCTRSNSHAAPYQHLLPWVNHNYAGSYLTLDSASGSPELVKEEFGRKVWKVPAAFTFHQGELTWNQEFFYYLQGAGLPDQVGQYYPTRKRFNFSGANEIWTEEAFSGEVLDSRRHIVSYEVTLGIAFERQ